MSLRLIVVLACSLFFMSDSLRAQIIWQPTNGPYGGIVTDLTIAPNGSIYAKTLNRGMFLSTDHGKTWNPAPDDSHHIFTLDPSNSCLPVDGRVMFQVNGRK